MRVTFHRDLYNPAVYGQARDGDVKEIPDDIARALIDKGTVSEWRESWAVTVQGLVSCIMPTANRRAFVPRALECWAAQTYQPTELIVLDTGADCVRDLMPKDDRIRYVEMKGKFNTGQLRNFCCQMARGEMIAHFDDDDWSHPARLAEQVEALAGYQVTAYNSMIFRESVKGECYLYTADKWHAIGTSLAFRKSWWLKNQFPSQQIGEDMDFVRRARDCMSFADGRERMVASIHAGNTSQRPLANKEWVRVDTKQLPKGYR